MCGSVLALYVWCVAGCANPSRKRECLVRLCGVCEERDGFGSVIFVFI